LKCIYCYAASRIQTRKQDYLTKEELKALIDEVNTVSKKVGVVLTGGEPLLSKHCLPLGKYAADSGNHPHLLTNALLITKENAQHISETFSLVKISIDGCDSKHHDFHRGKGSLKKVLNAIELLDSFNANISLSMTVTQRNINHIDKMVSKFGKRLSFQPLFSAGRAKSEKLGITGSEYYKALSSVKGVSPLSRLASRLNNARQMGVYKCAIGDAEISISETGDVYPCQLLHVPEFLAGNIRNNSFQEIYTTSDILNRCRRLDINRIKGCKQCSVRLICGGACRARAFHEKGRIDVSGDFCEYEKQAIIEGILNSYEI